MSYSCLDELGRSPTTDVVALCARDMVGEVLFRARGIAAALHASDLTEATIFVGLVLVGAVVSLRLAAFIDAAARSAATRWGAVFRLPRRAEPRTLVERHRRRPADTGPPRGDRP